jgi:hypothetical protein
LKIAGRGWGRFIKSATDRIPRLSDRHRFAILWSVDVKMAYGENARMRESLEGVNDGLNAAAEGTFRLLGGDSGDFAKGCRFIRPDS